MNRSIAPPSISLHSIRQLLPSASFVGCGDLLFRAISSHSKNCEPGTLFAAIAGNKHNGQQYAQEAVNRGACGVLTSVPLLGIDVPQCVVSDVRRCYGWLCQHLAGHPAKAMDILGVTGTNGKTTITWMLRSILNAASQKTGLLGTIENDDSTNKPSPSLMTTPDANLIAEWLLRMKNESASHAVIEVSSHALQQMRIAGISLKAAVLSNISHDHLDYHRDMKSYMQAKSKIQDFCHPDADFIINGDDLRIQEALKMRCCKTGPVTVGFSDRHQFQISILEQTSQNSRIELRCESNKLEMTIPIPGRFNIMNASLAAATAYRLGCSADAIITGIEQGSLPAGRMQRVNLGQPFDCFIDYAHTPDAIENVLTTMKPLVEGRLICLFGAGGNRDREKRLLMAKAASQADVIVLTSDNSRDEPVQQIFDDICNGFSDNRRPDYIDEDRAAAIQWAIDHAMPGDAVLLLGKGHETGQEVAGKVHPFDDRKQTISAIHQSLSHSTISENKIPA